MSDIFFQLQDELLPALRSGDLGHCERRVAEQLLALPPSPFHHVLTLSITNPPAKVAAHIDGFIRQESTRFKIRAVYAEMNGFDINTDRWYFDVFAYEQYGGHDDYGWLAHWPSQHYPRMTIAGLQLLQNVYASDAFHSKEFRDTSYLSGLLVVVKFQDLIRRAAALMKEMRSPVLATAHEYDFIYETRRDA